MSVHSQALRKEAAGGTEAAPPDRTPAHRGRSPRRPRHTEQVLRPDAARAPRTPPWTDRDLQALSASRASESLPLDDF